MRLDIFLENMRLDVDRDLKMSIDYVFSDLTNPTIQTGDGSQTFTIKGTQNNNAVFGQIWRLDRVTLLGGELNTSVYFNASKRTKCVIYINNEIFKRGYVKLNAIKSAKGVISYDVTFYSETVDVLRTLKESKLRDLPFPNDLRHTLDAESVWNLWTKIAAPDSDIDKIRNHFTYIMANNGIYDEFESSKWLTLRNGKYKVEDILAGGVQLDECAKREYRSYYQRPALRLKGLIELIAEQHGIQLDPAFFNDSNPYYANSVMALPQYNIMEQSEADSGLSNYGDNPAEDPAQDVGTLNIYRQAAGGGYSDINPIEPFYKSLADNKVFNTYWDRDINLSNVLGKKTSVTIELEFSIQANIDPQSIVPGHNYYYMVFPTDAKGILPTVDIYTTYGKIKTTLTGFPPEQTDIYQYIFGARLLKEYNYSAKYNAFRGILGMNGNNGYKTATSIFSPSLFYFDLAPGAHTNEIYASYKPHNKEWLPLKYVSEAFNNDGRLLEIKVSAAGRSDLFPEKVLAFYTRQGGDIKPKADVITVSSYIIRVRPITKAPAESGDLNKYFPASAGFTGTDITIDLAKNIRSGYIVDKSDIIDDETTQGDFLINYAKLFGLLFYTDRDGTPHLVTRNTFFKDYKVEDWTQKIDHAKEIQQRPIPFDAKYLSLRYQDGGTFYEDYYRQQYETEYGEQRMNTGFDFNENETELIPEILFYNTVMSQESTRVLLQSGNEIRMCFKKDTKILPALFEKDSNQRVPSDTKFNLLFDNGLQSTDNNTEFYLTDDNNQMLNEEDDVDGGQYCWLDVNTVPNEGSTSLYQPRSKYPLFSTLHASGKFSWTLGLPSENYAGWMLSDFPESSTIYANFWRNYIAEIYDVDNRIMTAYVRLTAADIAQFTFAKFVKIGDSLWHVNKIEQFDPLGNGTTKVEFLRVSSLAAIENAYKNGQTDMSGEDDATN